MDFNKQTLIILAKLMNEYCQKIYREDGESCKKCPMSNGQSMCVVFNPSGWNLRIVDKKLEKIKEADK